MAEETPEEQEAREARAAAERQGAASTGQAPPPEKS